ncbi:MAG: putative quinol monooxygenase [Rhizobiaceae bacterium]
MIHLIATLTIKPGSLPAVMDAVRSCLEATRREDGCISYELFTSIEDENRLVFVERWRDRAALDAHFNMPHLAEWRTRGGHHITSRRIEIITDGKVEEL